MYELTTRTKKVEKLFHQYIDEKIEKKLELLKLNPRRRLGAHSLKGHLKGKWACWIGSNIRMVYEIDEINKQIIVESIGTHKVYLSS
jgi:addiction module RelE/StbE family toxin